MMPARIDAAYVAQRVSQGLSSGVEMRGKTVVAFTNNLVDIFGVDCRITVIGGYGGTPQQKERAAEELAARGYSRTCVFV